MSCWDPYCHAEAFIDPDQIDWTGDGVLLPAGHGDAHRRHRGGEAGGVRAHCRAGARARVRVAGLRRARRTTDPRPRKAPAMTVRQNAQTAALKALIEAHATELQAPDRQSPVSADGR